MGCTLIRIRKTLDFTTAHTIATSLIHSKLDYSNISVFESSPISTQSPSTHYSTARAVYKTSKNSYITPVLKSLHWLKIEQRIQYKVISFTCITLQFNKLIYLNDLLHIQRNRNIHSSDTVTLQCPSVCCSLKLTDISLKHHAPALWIVFPSSFVNQSLINPASIKPAPI